MARCSRKDMEMKTRLLILFCLGFAGCHAPESAVVGFVSKDGDVRLMRPVDVMPTYDFGGRALLKAGWRVVRNGAPVGEGQEIVRLMMPARAADGSAVSEILQIGSSRDSRVLASCLEHGLHSGNGMRLPDATIMGRTWTAFADNDAGMSQSVRTTNYRLLHDETCYAIDRISYTTWAAQAMKDARPESEVVRIMSDVLATVEVGSKGQY